MNKEIKRKKDLADLFHNLAFFVKEDFENFDEKVFWKRMMSSDSAVYAKYKRIFDCFLEGDEYLY